MGEGYGFMDTPVYRRDELALGARLEGAAIVEEAASTTVLLPHDRLQVVATGELVIRISNEES
jgi:N-methylhydantoinase A